MNSIKVGTYNIANAFTDEQSETTNFWVRHLKVVKQIDSMDFDVLVLNELRPYKNRETGETMQPNHFLGLIKNYTPIYDYGNSSHMSFGNAVLYKKHRVFPVDYCKKWQEANPDSPKAVWNKKGHARSIFGVKFAIVLDAETCELGKELWVFTILLPVSETLKWKIIMMLNKHLPKWTGETPYILAGDFNLFEKFPEDEGPAMRHALEAMDLTDCCKEAEFSFGGKAFGTFLGFEQDRFKSSVEALFVGGKGVSRLDHIFASAGLKSSAPIVFADKMEIESRTTPSDHLPIGCTISI